MELKRALAMQMVQQNYSYREIQQILHVSLGFINKWNQIYQVQGVSRLKLGYWGIKGYLKQQKQEFLAWLKTCSYWSAEEVVEHLERNYNVIFKSKQSYYNLLHIAGLS